MFLGFGLWGMAYNTVALVKSVSLGVTTGVTMATGTSVAGWLVPLHLHRDFWVSLQYIRFAKVDVQLE